MIDPDRLLALLERACAPVAASGSSVAGIADPGPADLDPAVAGLASAVAGLRDPDPADLGPAHPKRVDPGPARLAATPGLEGDLILELPAGHLRAVLTALIADAGLHHLSAITALDNGTEIELLYHLWLGAGLSLRIRLSYDAPALPSIGDLLPVTLWYEREAHDLLGVVFEGHPNLRPLLLPEEWSGPPPLRKEGNTP